MRLTSRTVAVLGVMALVIAFPLLAQKTEQGKCEKACGIANLTPEQAAKIGTLKIEHQKAMLLLKADLKTKQLDLRQLMLNKAEQKSLEAKIDEMAKVSADIMKKCLAHRGEIARLLTDEQKKAIDKMCGGMGCGMGMGHGAGCGGHKMGMGKTGEAGHGAKGCAKECGSAAAGCEKEKK